MEWKVLTAQTLHSRAQPIPGVKIEDPESNLDELLHKDLRTIMIHFGTNNLELIYCK